MLVTKQIFCRNTRKSMLVETKRVCRNKYLHALSPTKDVFCRDRHVFCRERRVSVATKNILLAAPANDKGRESEIE